MPESKATKLAILGGVVAIVLVGGGIAIWQTYSGPSSNRGTDAYGECIQNGTKYWRDLDVQPLGGRSTWDVTVEWCERDVNHWPKR